MNRNTKIAVGVALVVVGFFFFGSSAISLFEQTSQPASTATMNTEDTTSTTNTGVTASNGLQVQDIAVGTGDTATAGSLITVNYIGTLSDGTKFDSSFDHGQPFQFVLGQGQVIAGWDQGLIGMKVGGKRRLVIPAALAYGAQQVGTIPPNSTLVFEVDLLNVQH